MAKTSTKKIAVSSKRLDADHLYYVDWYDGYYFHTYSQARKHAIKCLMELYLSRKKEKKTKVSYPYGVEYEIRINKVKGYASTIKMGYTPYAEPYAMISIEKKGNSFIITDSGEVPKKVTKLPLEKAVDYIRAKTL